MNCNIGLVSIAGEYEVGFNETPALLKSAEKQLASCGFNVITANEVIYNDKTVEIAKKHFKTYDIDVLCVCVGTWSEDHNLLDLMEDLDVPVILWAFPAVDTGSLCGVQQICCVLKELNRQYFYVYGVADDKKVIKEIGEISRAVALINKLRYTKIGSVGGRIKGMTEIAFDEFELKEKTGVRIINIDSDELKNSYEDSCIDEAIKYWQNIKKNVGKTTSKDEHFIAPIAKISPGQNTAVGIGLFFSTLSIALYADTSSIASM